LTIPIPPGSIPAELSDYPTVVMLPVLWGDMDSFQHVNNAVFFRWFETARIEYLETSRLRELLTDASLGPILAAISCNYRRQVRHPDNVLVGARVTRIGRTSMTMIHLAYSLKQQSVIADGDSTIVSFNYQANESQPIPESVRLRLAQVEGREL
jgi:acyl-CoA thioester hydrolase